MNCWSKITRWLSSEKRLAGRIKKEPLTGKCGRLLKRDKKKRELLSLDSLSF
jgi:hypothetical protein